MAISGRTRDSVQKSGSHDVSIDSFDSHTLLLEQQREFETGYEEDSNIKKFKY
mgnify:CR=1